VYRLYKQTAIEDLTLVKESIPKPGPGQVLVRIKAISLNYRDFITANGQYPGVFAKDLIPGSYSAGEVLEVGEGVQKFKKGDRVINTVVQDWISGELLPSHLGTAFGGGVHGTLVQFKVFQEHSLVIAPKDISYEEASTLTCAALTAYNALFAGYNPVGPTSYVLVLGTGGVSIAGAQLALAAGAQVILTSSSDEKIEKLKKLTKIQHYINYKKTPDWGKEVKKITNGRGVDHVIEIGGEGSLAKSIESVKRGGSVDVIGFLAGKGDPNHNFGTQILFTGAVVRGIVVGSRSMLEELVKIIDFHNIKPVVDKVFSFEDAQKAFKFMESAGHVGKIVITTD